MPARDDAIAPWAGPDASPASAREDAGYLQGLASRLKEALGRGGGGIVGHDDVAALRAVARRMLAASAAVPPPPPGVGFVRHERVETGGGRAWVLAIEAGALSAVVSVEVGDHGGHPRIAGGLFQPGAARVPAGALMPFLRPIPATPSRIHALGLPTDDLVTFRAGVAEALLRLAAEAPAHLRPPALDRILGPLPSTARDGATRTGATLDSMSGPGFMFRDLMGQGIAAFERVFAVDPCFEVEMGGGDSARDLFAFEDAGLDAWVAEASRALRPTGLPWPDAEHWSDGCHEFFAEPGETGRRRRQAARTAPGLARHIGESSAVRDTVDAGRPLFAALRDRIRLLLPRALQAGLTAAKLRRLAALEAPYACRHGEDEVFRAIALTPVDMLPGEPAGWRRYLDHGVPTLCALYLSGVDPVPMVRRASRLWTDPSGSYPDDVTAMGAMSPDLYEAALDGLGDMLIECGFTLVQPAGMPPWPGMDDRDRVVAARLLLRPYDIAAGIALQARWHRGMAVYRAVLGGLATDAAWAPLFAPFAHGDVTVACLTDAQQLAAEGLDGEDGDGVSGLDHCVGGYAPRCAAGTSHVASVRRVAPDGTVTRLSTVEFEAGPGGPPRAVQHRGLRNGEPPAEAVAALRTLEAALAEGTHPFAMPEAGEETQGFEGPSLEAAFQAWAPYLPARIARGGVPALKAHLAADPDVVEMGGLVDPEERLRERRRRAR